MRLKYIYILKKYLKEGRLWDLASYLINFLLVPISFLTKKSKNYPFLATLILTYRCNSYCRMCNISEKSGEKELNKYGWFEIIDDLYELGVPSIALTGGEPLLADDLIEIIRYAKNKAMFVRMATNGMLLDKAMAEELNESGIDEIGISIDSVSDRGAALIRGVPDSFSKACKAVKNLNQVSPEKIAGKPQIVISTIIWDGNIDQLDELVELPEKLGADRISFLPLHQRIDNNLETTVSSSSVSLSRTNAKYASEFLIDIKKKGAPVDNSVYYLKLFPYFAETGRQPFPCYAPYNSITIDCYRHVFPCFPAARSEYDLLPVNSNIKKYWYSQEYEKIKRSLRDCRDCCWDCQIELNLMNRLKK